MTQPRKLERPQKQDVAKVAEELCFELSPEDVNAHFSHFSQAFERYMALDEMPVPSPAPRYGRDRVHRVPAAENPLGGWLYRLDLPGAASGLLKGKSVALKDNICVAGVPMTFGSEILAGHVPDYDAEVVVRLLDAGACIAGTTACEQFGMSAGSHSCDQGPVLNPFDHRRTTGGSSSGSAAVVAAGDVPMALGCDQGGSNRIPAAFCGVYGMKPSYGLIPYTGIAPIETSFDHTGPITATVEDNALMLEVLAGPDGIDPRQPGHGADRYRDAMSRSVDGLRIGVLAEGFGQAGSMEEVDRMVRHSAQSLRSWGAIVEEVSIPEHRNAPSIWLPIGAEGVVNQMMNGNLCGAVWNGLNPEGMVDQMTNWRARASSLSPSLKNTMIIGTIMSRLAGGRYYARAQNARRILRQAYDRVLRDYDLIVMPTVPMIAPKRPASGDSEQEFLDRSFEANVNTTAANCTHHPAMSVPCGLVQGMPVGMMMVASAFDECTIYAAAAEFERRVDWRKQTA